MSRRYQPKTKEYAQVRVLSSDEVYDESGKINRGITLIGKVDFDIPNVVTTVNKSNKKTKFVDDTCNLTKKTKGELVDFFKNSKTKKGNPRKKAYLVRDKK